MSGVDYRNVEVTLSATRRLGQGRRLTAGAVTVSYVITVPASDASGIEQVLVGKSTGEVLATLQAALTAAGVDSTQLQTVDAIPTATVGGTGAGAPRTYGPVTAAYTTAGMALVMLIPWTW